MGGSAFSNKGLYMPRMPPAIYHKVLAELKAKLRIIYVEVGVPIEGPAKIDYGDIDFLVLAKENVPPPKPEVIAKLIDAKYYQHTTNSMTANFAMDWPYEVHEDVVVLPNEKKKAVVDGGVHGDIATKRPDRFIQVDICLCSSVSEYRYNLFQKAHGDILGILGAMFRRSGLLSSSSGFYVRIEELESRNRKSGRVKLTDDPTKVLIYLGLNSNRYWKKFDSWDDAMDYCSTCRFHDPTRGKQYDEIEETKEKLDIGAHDRSKSHKRPMFHYWLTEYLPRNRESEPGSACHWTREEVVEDAKKFFGPEFAREYEEVKRTGVRSRDEDKLWSDVRKWLPCEGGDLTMTMKGLKHEVKGSEGEVDEKVRNDSDVKKVREAFERGRWDEVKAWVGEHWVTVKTRQEQRSGQQSAMHLAMKMEKVCSVKSEENAIQRQ